MTQEDIEDLARLLGITFKEAEKVMAETEGSIEENKLIVAELSTIADRFDLNKAVYFKNLPKGKRGFVSPIICGYCGSIRRQEVNV